MATLFISDLHLDHERPATTQLFLAFLRQQAVGAEALYILGDLFEAWIGDDDDAELGCQIADALKTLADNGVPIYFIHGNRDFLLGQDFAECSGIQLLPEAAVIELYGTPTLIMHGDTLCTDDVDYQAFRRQVRSPQWQAQILALPLPQRRLMASQLRQQSQQAMQGKAEEITDVNLETVLRILHQHKVYRLIHGHTHRPAIHGLSIGGQSGQRIVLGDWYRQGSVLTCDGQSCRLKPLRL